MKTLYYDSCSRLNCGPCGGDIILCLDASLVLSGLPYIIAKLNSPIQELALGTHKITYRHYIEYDETLLVTPATALTGCNVKGAVCKGCLTSYIDNGLFFVTGGPDALTIDQGPFAVNKGERIHFYNLGGVEILVTQGSALVGLGAKLSTDAGNITTFGTDGGFYTAAIAAPLAPVQTVSDTSSVGHILAANDLSSYVKISAVAGNQIVVNPDGVYSPATVIPIVSVLDTTSVDMVLGGTVLSANVKISSALGNQVVSNPDGIFVPTPLAAPVQTISDTSTVDLSLVGVDLSAVAKVSATAGNQISVNADGLYIAPGAQTPITVVDSALIDLTANGVDNHTLTASIIPSATNGQVLTTVLGAPVWATPAVPAQTPLTVVDTALVNLTTSGTPLSFS